MLSIRAESKLGTRTNEQNAPDITVNIAVSLPEEQSVATHHHRLSVLEICAGAGGQALGLEMAGFEPAAAVEIDANAAATLRLNRPSWHVNPDGNGDVRQIDGYAYRGIDLLAGGVPCPPFSIAGKQLGRDDERDLFPEAMRLVAEAQPVAVLLENVRGFASPKFDSYRAELFAHLRSLGYAFVEGRLRNAAEFGVPQLRPRYIIVALKEPYASRFVWPALAALPPSVGDVLYDLMAVHNWPGVARWRARANRIAPTIVGGSKKHGGPDLGPTRARRAWAELGVDGLGIANAPPDVRFPEDGCPKLTLRMVARIQGFPDDWVFTGRKTAQYQQIGNALPPPFAEGIGSAIRRAIFGDARSTSRARRNSRGVPQLQMLEEPATYAAV